MPKNVRKRGRTPSRRRARTPMRGARRAVRRRVTRSRAGARTGGRADGIQRFNMRGTRTFVVNRTAVLGTITTLVGGQAFLYSPSSTTTPLYSTYSGQFTKFRVNNIKLRFELTTFEQTDDSLMPTIYIRRNEDPDKTTVGMSGTSMMLETGTIKKTFTAGSNVLEFTFSPMVMTAGLQTPTGSYMPMPRRMGYIDATQDITMYGVQYFVAGAGLNQLIIVTAEWTTTWKNPR